MPVAATDLILYCSANMPEDDTTTSGGAIATTVRPVFTQMAANDTIEALSDGTDTRTVTVTARKPDGSIASEAKALTSGTPIAFSTLGTVERILKVVAGATDATNTITVRRATGPVTIATIPPNETTFRLTFYDSSSESGQTIRYEKLFWRNSNATTALNAATVQLSADPSAVIRHGVVAAKGDSTSVANRKATPGGVTFVDDAVDQNVPTGVLGATENIGIWAEMTLAAENAPIRSTYTLRIAGTTV